MELSRAFKHSNDIQLKHKFNSNDKPPSFMDTFLYFCDEAVMKENTTLYSVLFMFKIL